MIARSSDNSRQSDTRNRTGNRNHDPLRVRPRWKSWAIRTLSATILTLLILWFTFQHIPAWYRPPTIQAADLPRIRASLPQTYQRFTDSLVQGVPFTFEIPQSTINAWITARAEIWPDASDIFPEWLNAPAIAFENNRIKIGAIFNQGVVNAIGTIHLDLSITGDTLLIRTTALRAGSLPIPIGLVGESMDQRMSIPESVANVSASLHKITSWQHLLEGVEIQNRFFWKNGERYFRIAKIESLEHTLTLHIEPAL